MDGPISRIEVSSSPTGEVAARARIGAAEVQLTGVRAADGRLQLAAELLPPAVLVELPGLASVRVSRVALQVKQAAAAAAASSEPAAATGVAADWEMSAAGLFTVAGLGDFAGTVSVFREDGVAGFRFEPDSGNSEITLDLPAPRSANGQPSIRLRIAALRILTGEGSSSPEFRGECELGFRGLPDGLARLWPTAFRGALKAAGRSLVVSVAELPGPFHWTIPEIPVGNRVVEPGTVAVGASDLSLSIDKGVSLSMRFDLGLPSELNRVFGVKADGTPAFRLFRAFDPAAPETSMCALRLSVSSAGVALRLETSPFEWARIEEGWYYCDFGEYGEVRFEIPTFLMEPGGAFQAAGAFEVIRTLKLPLTLIRSLFEACGLSSIAKLLPHALPLNRVRVVDGNGEFRSAELISLLESAVGKLPPEIENGIEVIGKKLSQLPDRFKQYLNTEIPSSFAFTVEATPAGNVNVRARVKDGDPPIRILQAATAGLLPGLMGFELRSIAFGECLGGSLFLLEIDGCIDRFDIVTLAGSLLLPENHPLPLPQTRSLSNRILLDRLLMVIVYETVIPIPVPVFYDELGIEYLGIEGFGFQIHVRFPPPKLGLDHVAETLAALRRFCTERSYLLKEADFPPASDLGFELGPTFLQLPEYLGGSMLGAAELSVARVSATGFVLALLNSLKTVDVHLLMQALPAQCRAGILSWKLGPFAIGGSWRIATPQELSAGNLPAPADVMLQSILQAAKPNKGFVALLSGKAALGADELEAGASYAMAADAESGAAFHVRGAFSGLLEIELTGRFLIDLPRDSGTAANASWLQGATTLSVAGRKVLQGGLAIDEHGTLRFTGGLDIFPGSRQFEIKGTVSGSVSSEGLVAEGAVTAQIAGVRVAQARASLTNREITVKGEWLGQSITLRAGSSGPGGALQFSESIRLQANFGTNLGEIKKAPPAGAIVQNVRIRVTAVLGLDMQLTEDGFRAGVNADLAIDDLVRETHAFQITVPPVRAEDLIPEIEKKLTSNAIAYFDRLYADAGRFLDGVQRGLIDPIGERALGAATVLRTFYRLDATAAAVAMTAAGFTAEQIGRCLQASYLQSAEAAAKALRASGHGVEQTVSIIRSIYQLSDGAAAEVLRQAGDAKDAAGRMAAKAVDHVSDKAKKAIDFFKRKG